MSAYTKQHAFIQGVRDRALEKLSPAMWQMLFDTRDHGDPVYSLHGRSAHGGSTWSHRALIKRGLMRGIQLTAAGYAACAVEWRDANTDGEAAK